MPPWSSYTGRDVLRSAAELRALDDEEDDDEFELPEPAAEQTELLVDGRGDTRQSSKFVAGACSLTLLDAGSLVVAAPALRYFR